MFLELQWRETSDSGSRSSYVPYLCAALTALLGGALMVAVLVSNKAAPDLARLVESTIAMSGVENPVTAVLLNFRSYDTLLEIAVLLIVAIAMMPTEQQPAQWLLHVDSHHSADPVLAGLIRWLVPLSVMVGGYLLWTGAYAPGGAFHAGAVIAGGGVALSLAGSYRFGWSGVCARVLLTVGLFVFVVAAVYNALATGTVLQYPMASAGAIILVIESAATVSIAAILLLLFTRLAQGVNSP